MADLVAKPLKYPTSDEDAAKILSDAGILQKEEFYALSDELRRVAFTLSEVRNAAVLARCKRQLLKLIKEGGSLYDFGVWVEDSGLAWEKWYTELVFRNATLGSYSKARWIAMNRPHMVRTFPALFYDAIIDSRTSEICRPLDGLWWWRKDFPQRLYPMNHHACRSIVRMVTERAASARPRKQSVGNPEGYTGPAKGWAGNQATDWQGMADRRKQILTQYIGG